MGANQQGPLEHRQTVHERQPQPGKQDVEGLLLQQGERQAIASQRDLGPLAGEDVGQGVTDAQIRLDNQDL